jgi:hypothetical protein
MASAMLRMPTARLALHNAALWRSLAYPPTHMARRQFTWTYSRFSSASEGSRSDAVSSKGKLGYPMRFS